MNILLVTEEPFLATKIVAMLGRAGHKVDSVNGGKAALDRLAREVPDLVVVDWFLSDVDGIGVIREVRARQGRQPAFVMLSELTEDAARNYARRAGAQELLVKPFNEEALLRVVRDLGGAPSSGGAARPASPPTPTRLATRRTLVEHAHYKQFDTRAARALSAFFGEEIAVDTSAKPVPDASQLTTTLSMVDDTCSLEVQVVAACSRVVGSRLAQKVLRVPMPGEDEIRDMLGEMCNVLLGRAKSAFRTTGFNFQLAELPGRSPLRGELAVSRTCTLTGPSGTFLLTIGVRDAA